MSEYGLVARLVGGVGGFPSYAYALAMHTVAVLALDGVIPFDLSAPIEVTGEPTAALLPDGRLRVVEGAGHGLYTSYADDYNAAVLDFIG